MEKESKQNMTKINTHKTRSLPDASNYEMKNMYIPSRTRQRKRQSHLKGE